MHLEIKQANDRTEQVGSTCIDKLYNLSKNGLLDATSDLRGSINATSAYEDAVTFLNTMWGPNLIVTASAYYIRFADPEVESVLKTALNKAEDEGITTQEASNTVANYFQGNTSIENFDEFRYFKNGGYSFYNCTNLESIDLGNHNSLPDFHNCENLKYFSGIDSDEGVLTIPEEVANTTISGQFYRCYGIHTVVVPNTFTSFYARTFADCDNLKKVIISDLNAWLNISFGSGTANPLWNSGDLYLNDTKITTIDFTNKQNINGLAMYGCASLTSITQLSDITSIGQYAFNNCSNLVISDLNLPNLISLSIYAFNSTKVQTISDLGFITNVPEGCFGNCKQLVSVVIPNTVITIGNSAFYGCSGLTSITIPSNISGIGNDAFTGCTALNGTTLDLSTFTNLSSVGSYALSSFSLTGVYDSGLFNTVLLGNHPFGTNLQNVELILRNNVTGLSGGYMSGLHTPKLTLGMPTIKGDCFYNLNNRIDASPCELILLNTVTTIEQKAFQHANIMSPFVIPSSVTSIGSYSLGIENTTCVVKFESSTPPTFSQMAFCKDGLQLPRISKILVPSGSRQAYLDALHVNQQGTLWSDSLVEEYIPTT